MSGGRVTINGSNFKISGGMATVNATGYALSHGKTTIGGTNYTINLRTQDMTNLLKKTNIVKSAGRNASSTGSVSLSLTTAGTYYAFVFFNGYIGIYKLVCTGSAITKTNLIELASYISISGTTVSLSVNCYGGSIFIVTFPGYTVAEADAIIGASSFSRLSARNSSALRNLPASGSNLVGKIAAVAVNTYVAFTKVSTFPSGTTSGWSYSVVFSNYSKNSTMLTRSGDNLTYCDNASGTETTVYGGSLLSLVI